MDDAPPQECSRDFSSELAAVASGQGVPERRAGEGEVDLHGLALANDNGLEVIAQEACTTLAKLDVLIEAAGECALPRLLALARRARFQAHKELVGSARDDPLVVRAVLEAENSLTRTRLAKRAALAANKNVKSHS